MDLASLQEVLNNIDSSPFARKLPPGIRPSSTKNRLRKKLNKKNKEIKPIGAEPSTSNPSGLNEDSLFNMINQVNKILKQNPNMVKKVSSCVNNIFENKDLLNSIVSQIEKEVPVGNNENGSESEDSESVQDQTLESRADELD